MIIDSHVHLRDEEQADKETIKHGLEVARDSGVSAVFDMPNTKRPVINKDRLLERLALAKTAKVPEVFYGIYLGATANSEQLKIAVELYRKFPQVVGMKLYAGESVGNLAVTEFEDQLKVYETLSREGYNGVLFVHPEKESEMNRGIFNHLEPITHSMARPHYAETESVREQIEFAKSTKFKGKLHMAHISVPKSVEIINESKRNGIDVSSGVCPHHLIFSDEEMLLEDGLLYKMNPPLRPGEMNNEMLELLKQGKIDWIETDHAPHTLKDKLEHPYMSGIPGLAHWPLFIEFLKNNEFTEKQIFDLTFGNIQDRFGIDVTINHRKNKDRRNDYSFNPYSDLEKELDWNPK